MRRHIEEAILQNVPNQCAKTANHNIEVPTLSFKATIYRFVKAMRGGVAAIHNVFTSTGGIAGAIRELTLAL